MSADAFNEARVRRCCCQTDRLGNGSTERKPWDSNPQAGIPAACFQDKFLIQPDNFQIVFPYLRPHPFSLTSFLTETARRDAPLREQDSNLQTRVQSHVFLP